MTQTETDSVQNEEPPKNESELTPSVDGAVIETPEGTVSESSMSAENDVETVEISPADDRVSEQSTDDAVADTDVDVEAPAESTAHEDPHQDLPEGFAVVNGEKLLQLPDDLYIPPDALEVFLETFEGPLDLLLYLVRRQNLDILNIRVAEITEQYMQYVEVMKSLNFELAAEYLVMAALLGEVKSRSLLPRPKDHEDEDEEDPRAELIRRLQEYERFKKAAEDIDELPRMGRDTFYGTAEAPAYEREKVYPDLALRDVLLAFQEVLHRADMFESHHVEKEKLSTRERMASVLDTLQDEQFVPFVSFFTVEEGRLGVVVTFLAMLELIKESLIEVVQNEAFASIHLKARVS